MASDVAFVRDVAGFAGQQAGLLAVAQGTNATGAAAFHSAVQELAGTVPAVTPFAIRAGDLAAAAAPQHAATVKAPNNQVSRGSTPLDGVLAKELLTKLPIVVSTAAAGTAPAAKQQQRPTPRKGPGLNS